ncbi:hypothetical protein CEUSTIGMA_g2276.t1 [Chlamydomonas eustigma]|uniref:Biogenesis of lysosome-related organelles complex 1 subunit 1 n=1 Tax=Chlamydomonas eustigma TaxID=1157962 RepID=A0A250WWD0_9CHLO|nr:hypothetical protein CEUSTIGMA_g2276.t1 [Chlamydomonas eustigma]|eukprot:GAX74830.1 hypothetical protein CEUSTIGMA_g2276.t1 [Chlamydomonas eustigma]
MFRSVIENHASQQKFLKEQQEFHKARALQHSDRFITLLACDLDQKVLGVYSNQLEIEKQSKATKKELNRLRSNVSELSQLVRKVTETLREVGDVGNYISVIEEKTQQLWGASSSECEVLPATSADQIT